MFGEVNLNQRVFQTLAKLGRYEEAAAFINDHKEDLLDIDAKYQAGVIMEEAGQFDKAISFLDDVIKQSPDYVNAYTFLAKATRKKTTQKKPSLPLRRAWATMS